MRICLVADNLDPMGGWGRLALKVSEGIKAHGHDVGFVLHKSTPGTFVFIISFGLGSLKNLIRFPVNLFRLRNFMKPYDAILCFDVNPNAMIASVATIGQRKKIIINALGTYSLLDSSTPVRNFFMRWAYRRADKVLVVSEFIKRQIEKSGFMLKNSAIVPVGVDTNFFYPLADKKKLSYPFILTVGALKPRKGYHISIAAFKLIAKEFPDLRYVIVGDQSMAPYYQELKELAAKLELSDRVVFLEKISDADLRGYYNSAELFLMTSIDPDSAEGFGMVYLEAGACGIPVIGAYDTGAEAAISNNLNGFLVQHDPNEIANAMRTILSDKELAEKMGANGIKRAKEFDWDKVIKLYLKYIE